MSQGCSVGPSHGHRGPVSGVLPSTWLCCTLKAMKKRTFAVAVPRARRLSFQKRLLGLSILMLGCTPCYAEPDSGSDAPATITASGHATLSVQPDRVQIDLTVVSQEAEASAAVAANAQASEQVESALRDHLGPGGSLHSSGYSLAPNYTYVQGQGQKLDGYVVRNRLRVSLANIQGAGQVIDRASQAGANEIGAVQFVLSDDDKERKKALAMATADALGRAGVMAVALDLKVLRVLSAQDGQAPVVAIRQKTDRLQAAGTSSAPTSILPGGVEIDATATVEVEVGP